MRAIRHAAAWLAVALAPAALPAPAFADDLSLRLIGSHEIASGTMVGDVPFGGVSGLERLPDGRFLALSDDRGGERGPPRMNVLTVDLDASGIHSVEVGPPILLRETDGAPLPADRPTIDPEALRAGPDGTLHLASEGVFDRDAAAIRQPFLRTVSPDGRLGRAFDVPPGLLYGDGETVGPRSNKGFEAIAVTPSGRVVLATEDAVAQDGPQAGLAAGSLVRLTVFGPETRAPVAQAAYPLPPIPVDAARGAPFGPDTGLVALLALDETSFLAVERSFAFGVGNTIRVTRAAIAPETTDTLALDSLADASVTPMTRELLLEMGPAFEGVRLDNIEAAAWGPTLASGARTLILVSDDNFNPRQRTLFMAFELGEARP